MMRLTLPYPPSDNHLYTVAHGRKVLSATGREYYRQVGQECLVQLAGLPRHLSTALTVSVDLYPPDQRRRDTANAAKALGDSLQKAGVILDDAQIKAWHLYWRHPVKHGRAEVTITELEYETFSLGEDCPYPA
jgi:crossover junction endodeoxyribonuclease RusA